MIKSPKPPTHGDKESRLRNATERFPTASPHCILGHAPNPFLLQEHHTAGRRYSDETIYICHNHHALVSDSAKDHPAKIPDCVNALESIGHLLLGLGDLLDIVIDELGPHPLREFLLYLRFRLKELGVQLIVYAAKRPRDDLGGAL